MLQIVPVFTKESLKRGKRLVQRRGALRYLQGTCLQPQRVHLTPQWPLQRLPLNPKRSRRTCCSPCPPGEQPSPSRACCWRACRQSSPTSRMFPASTPVCLRLLLPSCSFFHVLECACASSCFFAHLPALWHALARPLAFLLTFPRCGTRLRLLSLPCLSLHVVASACCAVADASSLLQGRRG